MGGHARFRSLHPTRAGAAELRTPRLRPRPLSPGDGPALYDAIEEFRRDLEHWLNWPATVQSVADAVAFCAMSRERWSQRTTLVYGLFSREGDRLLGAAGLHDIDWGRRTFELGYWLRSSAVGHGYAQEAVAAVVRMAFHDLRARRVEVRCDPDNVRSRHVADRLGCALEGRLRNATHTPTGQPRDTLVYALIDDDVDYEW